MESIERRDEMRRQVPSSLYLSFSLNFVSFLHAYSIVLVSFLPSSSHLSLAISSYSSAGFSCLSSGAYESTLSSAILRFPISIPSSSGSLSN